MTYQYSKKKSFRCRRGNNNKKRLPSAKINKIINPYGRFAAAPSISAYKIIGDVTPKRSQAIQQAIEKEIASDYSAKMECDLVDLKNATAKTTTPSRRALKLACSPINLSYKQSKTCRILFFEEATISPARSVSSIPLPAKISLEQLPTLTGNSKQVGPVELTKTILNDWLKKTRSKTQNQVMGYIGATAAAQLCGLLPANTRCEWLHLIAHSFGGADGLEPQQAENLVSGSSYCNTDMMNAEETIRTLFNLDKVDKITLTVTAKLMEDVTGTTTHIAQKINFSFKANEAIFKIPFYPMQYKAKPTQTLGKYLPIIAEQIIEPKGLTF